VSVYSSTRAPSAVLLAGNSKQSRFGQSVTWDEIPRRHRAASPVNRSAVAQVPPYRHEMTGNDEVLLLNQVIFILVHNEACSV
jgi:hypothetical protein